jgi:hypothetical protein
MRVHLKGIEMASGKASAKIGNRKDDLRIGIYRMDRNKTRSLTQAGRDERE